MSAKNVPFGQPEQSPNKSSIFRKHPTFQGDVFIDKKGYIVAFALLN